SRGGFIALRGNTHSAISPRGYFVRLSRVRTASTQARGKDLGRRGTERSGASADRVSVGGASLSWKNPGGLINPRSDSLNRMVSKSTGDAGTVKPQALLHVKIELYRGGSVERTIADSTDNTGSYEWTVASAVEDGTNYKVRISCAADASVYGESPAFTIANVGKIKVMSSPANARIWLDGQDMGLTNKTLENVPVGEHELQLTKDRYQDWSATVNVVKNQTANVSAALEVGEFIENFNDGIADYWENASSYASWFVGDGIYKGKSSHGESTMSYYGLGMYTNSFTYEAKVKRLTGQSKIPVGIAVGNQDFSKIWLLDISPGEKMYSIWGATFKSPGLVENEWPYVIWTKDTVISNTGWNACKIVADGNNFTFFINGKQVAALSIPDMPAEIRLGVWAATWTAGNTAGFDDVKVDLGNTAGSVQAVPAVPQILKKGKDIRFLDKR
ncbi:MAG: PEGA domain-containing protein, partial [Candidatus Aminicenantes bacterium]|nr:PEGA domain-containing protein [Candidatus Aminicenantes bacterium]